MNMINHLHADNRELRLGYVCRCCRREGKRAPGMDERHLLSSFFRHVPADGSYITTTNLMVVVPVPQAILCCNAMCEPVMSISSSCCGLHINRPATDYISETDQMHTGSGGGGPADAHSPSGAL